MFHCLPNVIETKKRQDRKWSHFPPFFFFEPFPKYLLLSSIVNFGNVDIW